MGSPLGPSGYTTSGVPGILTGNDGSLPSMVDNTQAKVTADYQAQTQQSTGWNSASSNFFGGILSGFPNVNGLVTAAIDTFLADLCDAITGATGGLINLNGWASSLRADASAALTNTSTIASGVTSNITGSAESTAAADVGPAVQLLNATVQASGKAPRIDIYNRSATWTKQTGMTTADAMEIGSGGGGAQGGVAFNTSGAAGGGGGQGGYTFTSGISAASLPSTAPVVVPVGGSGGGGAASVRYSDDFERANSISLGGSWRTDSGSQSAQIVNGMAQAFTPSTYVGETGNWNAWSSPLDTDNYVIQAQLATPSTQLATNNYTGIYCAAPTTYSGSSVLVAFVGDTSGGCGLITQTNAPSGAYIANGAQTGQTVVANSTTPFTTSSQIALTRNGNVFTGYINGTQVVQWTDTGNTVPTGSGNRLWGIITECNWPVAQSLYSSPAIASATARDVSWLSQPGGDGDTASFNGSSYQATGGKGGAGGGVDASGTRRPASGSFLNTSTTWTGDAGNGNQSSSASGGVGAAGQTGYLPSGESGGGGLNTGGGAPGTSSSLDGSAGAGPTGGVYGPASGGGGGFYLPLGSTSVAGQGGRGGFPGGGGGGGGASLDGLGGNGPGGAGGDGQVVITTYFT
ncbi:DUF7257 domain-containing protein [Nocardia vaccinii]|uniref:DUF7257 domain-containing protein n=1 Tax=Nocardia vaccinii TaxID=1822 RepID=UPI00082F05F9|nr:hypothetical protein [Nocardia vaccinii]